MKKKEGEVSFKGTSVITRHNFSERSSNKAKISVRVGPRPQNKSCPLVPGSTSGGESRIVFMDYEMGTVLVADEFNFRKRTFGLLSRVTKLYVALGNFSVSLAV